MEGFYVNVKKLSKIPLTLHNQLRKLCSQLADDGVREGHVGADAGQRRSRLGGAVAERGFLDPAVLLQHGGQPAEELEELADFVACGAALADERPHGEFAGLTFDLGGDHQFNLLVGVARPDIAEVAMVLHVYAGLIHVFSALLAGVPEEEQVEFGGCFKRADGLGFFDCFVDAVLDQFFGVVCAIGAEAPSFDKLFSVVIRQAAGGARDGTGFEQGAPWQGHAVDHLRGHVRTGVGAPAIPALLVVVVLPADVAVVACGDFGVFESFHS